MVVATKKTFHCLRLNDRKHCSRHYVWWPWLLTLTVDLHIRNHFLMCNSVILILFYLIWPQHCMFWTISKNPKTSTTPSCSGPIPAKKSRGNSVLGAVFSHTMPKMEFDYSHRFSWEKNTLNWYITCHGYINIHHSPFIGLIKINRKFRNITPLDHGGPEMKCTYFHRNCWKKIAQNDRLHAMDISRIAKVILKNCQKIEKMTPLTVKIEF